MKAHKFTLFERHHEPGRMYLTLDGRCDITPSRETVTERAVLYLSYDNNLGEFMVSIMDRTGFTPRYDGYTEVTVTDFLPTYLEKW